MTRNHARTSQKASKAVPRERNPITNILADIGAVLLLLGASLIIYLSLSGDACAQPPCLTYSSPIIWFVVGFALLLAFLLLYGGTRPSLRKQDDEFLLVKRRPFGTPRVSEVLEAGGIRKVQFVSLGRGRLGGERPPAVRVELMDGRLLRLSGSSLDENTYRGLSEVERENQRG